MDYTNKDINAAFAAVTTAAHMLGEQGLPRAARKALALWSNLGLDRAYAWAAENNDVDTEYYLNVINVEV